MSMERWGNRPKYSQLSLFPIQLLCILATLPPSLAHTHTPLSLSHTHTHSSLSHTHTLLSLSHSHTRTHIEVQTRRRTLSHTRAHAHGSHYGSPPLTFLSITLCSQR